MPSSQTRERAEHRCGTCESQGAGGRGFAVVRVVLGLLLLAAAGLKAHHLATEPVVGDGLLDNRWLLMAEVELELAFGLWLLAGLAPKWTWRAAVLCFAGFACITLYKALSGETTCGCFGRVEVSPWYTLVLDLAAVAALLVWRPNGQGLRVWGPRSDHGTVPFGRVVDVDKGTVPPGSPSPGLRLATVAVLWLVMGMPAAWAMASFRPATVDPSGVILGEGQFVVLEPEQWIGKPFPLLPYIDIGSQLGRDIWAVLFYHHDCPTCRETITKWGNLSADIAAGKWDGPQLALVEMPPYDASAGHGFVERDTCAIGRLSEAEEWFLQTPTLILIREGTVVGAESGKEVSEVLTHGLGTIRGEATTGHRPPSTALGQFALRGFWFRVYSCGVDNDQRSKSCEEVCEKSCLVAC